MLYCTLDGGKNDDIGNVLTEKLITSKYSFSLHCMAIRPGVWTPFCAVWGYTSAREWAKFEIDLIMERIRKKTTTRAASFQMPFKRPEEFYQVFLTMGIGP
ncbi:RNA exonuclease 1-like protein [Platysternon megacephalum]|uniref:RNA exonuclease 1-like protein n=1 Tax=Platysternon megacephalum TaxID=55544 RepID=A0A4D9ETM4_9SAUR|nr:RNA exonuclease 1-like protein [Platysternon megacephalum]